MKYKTILLILFLSIVPVSCHQEKIEIYPTNKYIATYKRLKDKPGYNHSYGYVFEVKNNMSENLIFDSIKKDFRMGPEVDVYEIFERERPLSKILVQNGDSCRFLTDTLAILPGETKKLMIFDNDYFKNISVAKKLLRICMIDDVIFYFHTNKDTIVIKKNTPLIHKLPDDEIQYFIDNKQVK